MDFMLANSLSPVMWRTLGLLLFGNIAIGILEGLLLAALLRTPVLRTVLLTSLANYLSTWVGFLVILPGEARPTLIYRLFAQPIHHPHLIFWLSLGLAWLISVVVEWPFAKIVTGGRWLRPLAAVAIANTTSYLALSALFFDSTIALDRDTRLVEVSELATPIPDGTIYFLDSTDGTLMSMRLDGSAVTRLRDLPFDSHHDVLAITLVPANPPVPAVSLIPHMRGGERLLMEIPLGRADSFIDGGRWLEPIKSGWWLGVSGIADLRAEPQSDPRLDLIVSAPLEPEGWRMRPHGNSGIEARHVPTGTHIELCYDTPFGSWFGRSLTLLEGDLLVFEFGSQICLLSLRERSLAFLARGRGPVVVLDQPVARLVNRSLE